VAVFRTAGGYVNLRDVRVPNSGGDLTVRLEQEFQEHGFEAT